MKKAVHFMVLFFSLCLCVPCLAQEDEQSTDAEKEKDSPGSSSSEKEAREDGNKEAGENSKDTEKDFDEELQELDEELDALGMEDAEVEEGKDDLSPPKSLELDLSALGEIDPEKELSEIESKDPGSNQKGLSQNWTERAMDILELHGYFRVRPELFHNFQIRGDNAVYDRTAVRQYNGPGADCRKGGSAKSCKNSTLAGANMRFRVEPTINVSEMVWVKTQIDFLDNIMLGSTPKYWQIWDTDAPTNDTPTVHSSSVQGWDMGAPDSKDMIVVRRAWGEVMTPFGQLRFGRMGDHWGLGMLHNSGNGLEQDFGDTVDRLMFAAKINDWLIAPAFDFPSEGISATDASGRPFDMAQLDDSYRLVGIVAYKHDKEEQEAMLKRGDWVVNTGLYFPYRWQVLSFEQGNTLLDPSSASYLDDLAAAEEYRFYRRDSWTISPDFWLQFLKGTFHLELEVALIYGEIGNPDRYVENYDQASQLQLLQYGGVIQVDYGLLSNQLRFGLEFAFSSGDEDVEGLRAPATYDQVNDSTDDKFSSFSFNPAYNTDLILYRHILGSINQSYYFKVWLKYDFLKNVMGRNLGLQANILYSRASMKESTINNTSNLGVEIDIQVLYKSDDNFYAGIKYGVLFPLAAFKGSPYGGEDIWLQRDGWNDQPYPYTKDTDLSIPQTVQAFLGITF
jgi:uncharacterized protein (TIGR04551 family)